MRYIEIPQPVQLIDHEGEKVGDPVSFPEWLGGPTGLLSDSTVWGKGAPRLFMHRDIKEKLRDANGLLPLSEDEWKVLCEQLNENAFHVAGASQVLHFIEAVLDASKKKPTLEPGTSESAIDGDAERDAEDAN